MADKALKVMIELAADAKGVRAGTQQATAQLEKLQKVASDVRSLAVVGYAMDFASKVAAGVQAEFQHITDAAHAFSPDAMRGQMALDMATQQSDQMLADAFGPIVGLIDQIKAQALIDVAQYFVDNKESIGAALESIALFGVAVADVTAQALVAFSDGLNYLMDLVDNPMSVVGDTAVGVSGAIFGGDSMITQGVVWIADTLKEKLGGT